MSSLNVLAALPAESIPLVASPTYACAYCWRVQHAQDGIPFPEQLSSTICLPHIVWIKAQRKPRHSRLSAAN